MGDEALGCSNVAEHRTACYQSGNVLNASVNIIARPALVEFWTRHPHAEAPLRAWYSTAVKATWAGPSDVKAAFGTSVDFIGDNRAIFDIGGNKYRLIVRFAYPFKSGQIKFVGTHKEYDRIDPLTVERKPRKPPDPRSKA